MAFYHHCARRTITIQVNISVSILFSFFKKRLLELKNIGPAKTGATGPVPPALQISMTATQLLTYHKDVHVVLDEAQ